MSLPTVLSEVRNYWVQHYQLGLDETSQEEWVRIAILGNQVVLLDRLEFEETELQSLLVLHFLIILSAFLNGVINCVLEDVIPEVKILSVRSEVDLPLWDGTIKIVLDPLLKDEELQDACISNTSVEVCII